MNRKKAFIILGIPENSSPEEVKKAYRQKAMQFHPDKNPGDSSAENKFKEINAAYELLTKGNAGGLGSIDDLQDMVDAMFSSYFGHQKARKTYPVKNPPFNTVIDFGSINLGSISLTLQNVILGDPLNIKYKIKAVCKSCLEDKNSWAACSACRQTGFIVQRITGRHGSVETSSRCNSCGGLGWRRINHCRLCKDKLYIQKDREINVTIPPNLNLGHNVRVPGKGNENWNIHDGDLFFEPKVRLNTDASKLTEKEKALFKTLLGKLR